MGKKYVASLSFIFRAQLFQVEPSFVYPTSNLFMKKNLIFGLEYQILRHTQFQQSATQCSGLKQSLTNQNAQTPHYVWHEIFPVYCLFCLKNLLYQILSFFKSWNPDWKDKIRLFLNFLLTMVVFLEICSLIFLGSQS